MVSTPSTPSAWRRGPAHAVAALIAQATDVLAHWPWLDTLRTLRQRFRDDHLGVTAASLTFTTLISLVPAMTVMLALFTAFPIFSRFQQALQQYFLRGLAPETIARPVMQALTQFASNAGQLGSAGVVVLLLTALSMVFTIDRTLNGIWRVPKRRPLAQRVLLYWSALTLGPLLLGASLSLTSYALSASRGFVAELPGGLGLVLRLLEGALLASGAAAVFRYVPNTAVRWRHAWAGGVFVALAFELAKRALAWYVAKVPTYSVVYGAFATLPILLLWIYLVWVIVLLGAVIAAYAPTLALHVARLPDRPGEKFALALALLARLAQVRAAGAVGLRSVELAAAVRVDPLQVAQVLEVLSSLGLAGRLAEADDPRWLLLVAPEQTAAQPLVDALLLGDRRHSAAFRGRVGLDRARLAELLPLPADVSPADVAKELRP